MGRSYIAGPGLAVDPCAGEVVAVAVGHEGTRGHVWGARGVGLGRGERREGKQGGQGIARVSALTGALGRPARMRAGARGGRGRRGTKAWCAADVEEH